MQHSLKPLAAAIYSTTGTFIDRLREDSGLMDKMARHFATQHKEDYEAAIHNVSHSLKL